MASALTRLGPFDALLASRWTPRKQKSGEWMCQECWARRQTLQQQRRSYAYVPFRPTTTTKQDARGDERGNVTPRRRVTRRRLELRRQSTRAPWGLDEGAILPPPPPPLPRISRQGDRRVEYPPLLTRRVEEREGVSRDDIWEEVLEKNEDDAVGRDVYSDPVESAGPEFDFDGASLGDKKLLDIDYTVELRRALRKNSPDMVLRCIFAAVRVRDWDFVRGISKDTFAEVIRLTQPLNFVNELASAHLRVSDAVTRSLGVASIRRVALDVAETMKSLLDVRSAAGIKLGFQEYKLLLRGARDLGDRHMALKLWNDLHKDGFTPDTDCYNYYMASVVSNGVHNPVTRHNLRVTPFNTQARKIERLGPGYVNFRLGSDRGLKQTVMDIFGEMLKNGAIANEESFRIVITAAAREGDIATVKSILKKAWDVDVDALMTGKKVPLAPAKPLDEDSPLRPSKNLLFAIAHAFGINNDIPAALRTVDFVSERYQIPIDQETWAQLFEWTFVLASPRTGAKYRTDGSRTGQLPSRSLLSLWQTLISEPYNVKPTMGMYNHLIKNLYQRQWPLAMIPWMEKGRLLYRKSRVAAEVRLQQLEEALAAQSQDGTSSQTESLSIDTLRRSFEAADLIRKRNLFWVKRWLRLLLASSTDWVRADSQATFGIQVIPQILRRWSALAPSIVRYETSGGIVEFAIRSDTDIDENRAYIRGNREVLDDVLDKAPLLVGGDWSRDDGRRTVSMARRPPRAPHDDGVEGAYEPVSVLSDMQPRGESSS